MAESYHFSDRQMAGTFELLKEYILQPGAKGNYNPGFLMTDLSFDVNVRDICSLSKANLGTFAHEYIHYLQNVSTPFGLWQSMVIYSALNDFFGYVRELEKPITIPVKGYTPQKDIARRLEILKEINGETNCYNLKTDEKITFSRNLIKFTAKDIERITVHAVREDGCNIDLILGAYIIKESMAVLIQELIDPDSKLTHKDVPYNVVSILANQHFPNISSDIRKIASICFISLFTLSPGVKLIDYLSWANENSSKTIQDIFSHFTEDSIVKTTTGRTMSVNSLCDDLADKVKKILGLLLYGEINSQLDYIGEVIDRVKVSEGLIPLLRLLVENEISPELVQMAVDTCGIPAIIDSLGRVSLPTSIVSFRDITNGGSRDVLLLAACWGMYTKLTDDRYYRCPLYNVCNGTGTAFKEECDGDNPWYGKECLMTIVGHRLNLV